MMSTNLDGTFYFLRTVWVPETHPSSSRDESVLSLGLSAASPASSNPECSGGAKVSHAPGGIGAGRVNRLRPRTTE
jgi:hypothetical protein